MAHDPQEPMLPRTASTTSRTVSHKAAFRARPLVGRGRRLWDGFGFRLVAAGAAAEGLGVTLPTARDDRRRVLLRPI